MAYIDDIARPDSELAGQTGTSNQQKFLDIWWRICSKTGLSKWALAVASVVLNFAVPKYDKTWTLTKTTTNLFTEVGALPANFGILSDKIDALAKQVATPTLTDAQVQAIAAQIAASHTEATPDEIAAAVVLATKNQFNK